jgi:hypothetical protein
MARRTIARPPTPVLPSAAGATATAPAVAIDTGPSASDLLENKLEQLKSLLWCCHGDGNRWFEDAGPKHLDNVLWIATELANEAAELFQQCEEECRAPT